MVGFLYDGRSGSALPALGEDGSGADGIRSAAPSRRGSAPSTSRVVMGTHRSAACLAWACAYLVRGQY